MHVDDIIMFVQRLAKVFPVNEGFSPPHTYITQRL